ncbi:uncharacterized protein LOC143512332 isoform X2 [Brachyhypopomus gauderio]|uniref:uncharacterized protein LOC143512332 isoform X2 n=1 Tax=Brachyhypopomus gauderio TaxID=698409 RepID=UPI0040430DCC
MEDQTRLSHLDSLLLQLALETRELAQKRHDLKQQVQICKDSIQEKKQYIDGTQKSIKKLDEGIMQKQNTVKCYRESVKSLCAMGNHLLQYEKTLEDELLRRQESCNQDMKMFQERIENYKKIFQQHKEEYCQNALAKKLLNIQAENEEIEKRIRATEDQIIAKEKELKALQGRQDTYDSDQIPIESQESLSVRSSRQDDISSHQDFQAQGPEAKQEDNQISKEVNDTENNKDQADDSDESNASQVITIGTTIWSKPNTGNEQIQGVELKLQEEPAEGEPANVSCVSENMEEMLEMMEVDVQQESGASAAVEACSQAVACNPSSPIRMKAVLSTPTFSVNSSPTASPGGQESSEMPAFVFPMNSGPSTSAFSGFACGFDIGSSQHEESPFTFTSSYFSNKKSPEPVLPGFLFDESESHSEVDFAFSFGAKSPEHSSSTQDSQGGVGNIRPFSFSFDKF